METKAEYTAVQCKWYECPHCKRRLFLIQKVGERWMPCDLVGLVDRVYLEGHCQETGEQWIFGSRITKAAGLYIIDKGC